MLKDNRLNLETVVKISSPILFANHMDPEVDDKFFR